MPVDPSLTTAPGRSSAASLGRRAGERTLALLLGLLTGLLLFEAALWGAHLALDTDARGAGSTPGERRILCIGDSNTYGIHLPPEHSYPGRLQALLDVVPQNPWRVVNLGYPGQNSAQVRARLAPNLGHYRPEIVICWIGVNNTWSQAMRHLWETPDEEPAPPWSERLVQSSRALGALRMLRNRLLPPPATATVTGPSDVPESFEGTLPAAGALERGAGLGAVEPVPEQQLSPEAEILERNLEIDLGRIRTLTEAAGAHLVLVEYPLTGRSRQAAVNGMLRRFAEREQLPFILAGERLLSLASTHGWQRVLFSDHHANAEGNYAVALEVLDGLLDAGLLPEQPLLRAVPPFERWIEGAEQIAEAFRARVVESGGGRVRLELEGPPGWGFWIGVEALGPRGAEVEPVALAIAKEEQLSIEERRAYFGALDAQGRGSTELRLPPLPAGVTAAGPQRWRLTANANPPPEDGDDGFWSVLEIELERAE